jgi:hypothetical protein
MDLRIQARRIKMLSASEFSEVTDRRAVGGIPLDPIHAGARSASKQLKPSIVPLPAGLRNDGQPGRVNAFERSTFGKRISLAEENARQREDRRSTRRYRLDLAFQYEIGPASQPKRIGHGRLIDISSGGVLFHADCAPAPGVKVNLKIAWPAKLNGAVPLTLHIKGHTVRTHGADRTALRILKAEFRTASQGYAAVLQAAG